MKKIILTSLILSITVFSCAEKEKESEEKKAILKKREAAEERINEAKRKVKQAERDLKLLEAGYTSAQVDSINNLRKDKK